MKNIALLIIGIVLASCSLPDVYNIKDYGAKSNRKMISTKYIQKAIDRCSQRGGGVVYIPPGTYITGTLILKSNVNLYLEKGASLQGSSDSADYMVNGIKRGIIFADDATNISITGNGEIFGRGSAFHNPDVPHNAHDYDRSFTRQGERFMDSTADFSDGPISYRYRPGMMIVLLRCSQVEISDVILRDSPEWTIRIGDCENVVISNITILNNLLIPNSDGIHLTHSRNVRISGCHIEAGDDGIIVTGFPYDIDVDGNFKKNRSYQSSYGNQTRYAENVTVSNSTISSRSAGIRVGYGVYGIRNCVFQNLVITNSNRGIGIFSRDTGAIEHILFNNIIIETRLHNGDWWGKGEPIHISAITQKINEPAGKIQDISFTDISIVSETGIVIWSAADSLIQDIRFNNLRMDIKNSPMADSYGGNIDLRPVATNDMKIFKHDIPAILCYQASDLSLRDIKIKWLEPMADYFNYALELEKVNGAIIENFYGESAKGKSMKAINVKGSKDVKIQ